MHLPSDFEVNVLKPGEQVPVESDRYVGQLKPTKLHVLPVGALDSTPSYLFELVDSAGFLYIAQITDTMLTEGLDRAGQLRGTRERISET